MVMVAVLFARSNSVYKSMPGCDVFDLERDARTYSGNSPVIAHPPSPTLPALAVLTASGSEVLGAAFRPGSLCNTRTHCNGCSK